MTWYRFWKKSGPTRHYAEEYIWLSKESYPTQETVLRHCEYWAERMPGGHETMYEYGFKRVSNPPRGVLEKMILEETEIINERNKYLQFLQKTLDKTDKKKI